MTTFKHAAGTWQIGENAFIDADGPYRLLSERERCDIKKNGLESQLRYQQARHVNLARRAREFPDLVNCKALKQLEQRLSATKAELQELNDIPKGDRKEGAV